MQPAKEPATSTAKESSAADSHGRLVRFSAPFNPVLRRFSTEDIAGALLARLESEPGSASYAELMRLQHVLDELNAALGRSLDVPSNRFSSQFIAALMHFVRHCWQTHGIPVEGATHADMGCGSMSPLGRMFAHLLLGVERGLAFELDPPQNEARAVRHLADLASAALVDPEHVLPGWGLIRHDILDRLLDFDLAKMAKGDASGIPQRLQFVQRSFLATGLHDGEVDVIFSNSVLEHVAPLDELMQEWRRILSPGGFCLHGIDMADHRSYGSPSVHRLQFLEDSDSSPIVHECNRKRWVDFRQLFERNGFEVVEAWPLVAEPLDDARHSKFVEPWRSMDKREVEITWVQTLLKKV
jgi:SAM-dependent methyltransferase